MRRNLNRAVIGMSSAFICTLSTALATPVAAPVLDIYGGSLTVQLIAGPRFDQRGVDIDGTLRQPVPLGWAVNGDPLGGGYSGGRTLGDVNLCTGSYHPTDIDIALPTLGLPVVVGRTYSCVQVSSGGTRTDYESGQGYNWMQEAQPYISLYAAPGHPENDVLYLVYGADRFIEFKRTTDENSTTFKAKNGAAGVFTFTAAEKGDPDLYTYYDQRGDKVVFFGFDGYGETGSQVKGQIWKMTDPAGVTAYVGDSSSAATAIGGYTSLGHVATWYDGSGRKYVFTYGSVGGVSEFLLSVEAQINSSGWVTKAEVQYDYYSSTDNDKGLLGDLRLVTITMKGTGSNDYVRRKYYRYYTRAWSNSDGRRGEAHQLKMVVGFEGTRQYDYAGDSTFDQDYYGETDANLKPYAESYFEYPSGDYRISSVTFNGNCGCGGGASGTYTLTYAQASGYSTAIASGAYDNAWEQRTVIAQPDGNYVTQYFDETGAVYGRVLTNAVPTGSPTKTWVTGVERDSAGCVTYIHSPANLNAYTHSTGAITYLTGAGLVTVYTRHSAASNFDGLRDDVRVKEGTSGSATKTSEITFATERQLAVGTSGVTNPFVGTSITYPDGSTAVTTTYGYDFWSGTSSNVQYIAPQRITTTNPTVTASTPANNGSGSATVTYRYMRTDGSTAFTKDAGGIIFYTRRTAFGQAYKQVADCDTSSGDIDSSDAVSYWSGLGLASSGSPIHVLTTMSYDDQGRLLSTVLPSVNGGAASRTAVNVYTTLADGRLTTMSFPRKVSTTYYGPVSFTMVNNAGRAVRTATIQIPGGGSVPSTSPGSDWSAMVDTVYDLSGMRATETDTYTTNYSTSDAATYDYDAMGRRDRVVDVTGTITRSVFDERGMLTERWLGTNDNAWTSTYTYASPGSGGGSSDMVKVELLEYDGGSGGGNGLLTTRTQDEDGTWGGGATRVTTYAYDYRGRMIFQLNPVPPHTVNKYDNSNRVIAVGQYSAAGSLSASTDPTSTATSSGAIRVALNETAYDQKGQVFETTRWEIDQTYGTKGSSQVTDNWYDADGRLVKSHGAQITKTWHDRLGRPFERFVIAYTDDSAYSDALLVGGDTVLEQSHSALDPLTGRALAQWMIQRAHDDAIGGTSDALDTNADSDDMKLTAANLQNGARAQITAMAYDDWDRVVDSVSYGTYEGHSYFNRTGWSAPSRGTEGTPPAFARTSYAYDDHGRVYSVKDPIAIDNRTEYDFAGRRTATVDNYVNGNPQTTAGTNNDQDRRTDYTYTNGLVTRVRREMPKTSVAHDNDQDTDYSYDTTGGASNIKVKNLLTTVDYPYESTPGDREVSYVYNALSQVVTTTDPAGNIITNTYDAGGRVVARVADVTTNSTGFDGRVYEIDTTYEPRGMVNDVQQKDSHPTVLDEVALVYDGWGNLVSSTQDPDSYIGAAVGRDEYTLTWTYDLNTTTGGCRNLYLDSWTIPNGSSGFTVYNIYDDAIDIAAGRPSWAEDKYANIFGAYHYLGANTVVGARINSGVFGSFLYDSGGSADYYKYMDVFNRVTSFQWGKGNAGSLAPAFDDWTLSYDVQGNLSVLSDKAQASSYNPPVPNYDYISGYDNLRRLTQRVEGKNVSGSITTQFRLENCGRNLAGRIAEDQIDLNNNGNYTNGPPTAVDAGEMDDTRSYNKRNELKSRTVYDSAHPGGTTVNLTYDLNGDLTDDGEKYQYHYNPFGQLVQIYDTVYASVAANYTYNGLGQRISEQLDTNDSGNTGVADKAVDSYDPVFYMAVDPQGRRVATFRTTDTYPKETFVYHSAGIGGTGSARGPGFSGGVLMRDRNDDLTDPTLWATESAGSTRAERVYYCSDPRGNVVALVGSGDGGALIEQYRYSPSGVPYGVPLGDLDGDGKTDSAGTDDAIYTYVAAHSYETRGDLDFDGNVDSADHVILVASDGLSTGRGKLSAPGVGNRKGVAQAELFGTGLETMCASTLRVLNAGLGVSLQSTGGANGGANPSLYSYSGAGPGSSHMVAVRSIDYPLFLDPPEPPDWLRQWLEPAKYVLPDAATLPGTLLEGGPDALRIWACTNKNHYRERHEDDPTWPGCEFDPVCMWLTILCNALSGNGTIQPVYCQRRLPGGGPPDPSVPLYLTWCPNTPGWTPAACCQYIAPGGLPTDPINPAPGINPCAPPYKCRWLPWGPPAPGEPIVRHPPIPM